MKYINNVLHTLRLVIILLTFICLTLVFTAWAQQESPSAGVGNRDYTISFGGLERHYAVHAPPNYDPMRPIAVILNFHGGGGNSKTQRTISQMDQSSDRYGFIVVYPEGTGAKLRLINPEGYTWNAGACCGWAMENRVDDVGFVNAMLDDLEKYYNIDKKRVYATGISNGAMLCYRLACELSHRIAAIAPVAGTMGVSYCRSTRPVSVMHFHGTADQFVPFAGGAGSRSLPGQYFESVETTIAFWVKQDGISGGPARTVKSGQATGYYYGPGAAGAEVVLWVIEGGGHTWPGGRFGFLGQNFLGPLTQDISANDLMWEFFQKHPIK
jgi:polyhydroxybutyrate depolymerase